MPEGVQKAEIDIRTGQLAAADSTTKRTELFINGTAPAAEAPGTDLELPEPLNNDGEQTYEPAPLPEPQATATPPAHARPAPRLEDQNLYDNRDGTHLQGTITLDIDPTTGLIAAPTCPVIRTKTFAIGQEPRQYCGPQYHNGKTVPPATTRPRVVSP
jgi:hypothetical protein